TSCPRICVRLAILFFCALSAACGGCFREMSFDIRPGDLRMAEPSAGMAQSRTTRQWLSETEPQLAHLLPHSASAPVVTEQISGAHGKSIDVVAHFGMDPCRMRTLAGNFSGLLHTAQVVCPDSYIDNPPPEWPGFQTVWILINEQVS